MAPLSVAACDRATADLLDGYWRLHPVEATHAGVRRYDGSVADLSAAGLEERSAWRTASRAALHACAPDALDETRRLDRAVALAELAGQEVEADWQWPRRAPGLYLEEAMKGLHYLLARPDLETSQEERDRAVLGRLAGVAPLLAQGEASLDAALVAPELVEIASVAVRGAQDFLRRLELPAGPEGEDRRHQALAALARYEQLLTHDLRPGGSFALGQEGFERLLREKHGLDLAPEALYAYGRELSAELEGRLVALGRRVGGGRDWRDVVAELKEDHPSRAGLLQAYRDEAARARSFVVAQGLAPLAAGDRFAVEPTAPFLRATMPLGHYDKPPPFAADSLGVLCITPIAPDLPSEDQERLLQGHCWTAIRAICLHESYPGHHLQLAHARLRATAVRRQFPSTLYTEGWGLYCEELMEEAGYYDTSALSLWRLKNAMWRAVRMMVDVGLHTGRLSLAAAAQLLEERAGLEPATARGEALRYTTSPTQPSSYVLGRDGIVALRRARQQQEGERFSLAAFHDWLLGYSSVSPPLIPTGREPG